MAYGKISKKQVKDYNNYLMENSKNVLLKI